MKTIWMTTALLAACCLFANGAGADDDAASLKAQLERAQKMIQELEARLAELQARTADLRFGTGGGVVVGPGGAVVRGRIEAAEWEKDSVRKAAIEAVERARADAEAARKQADHAHARAMVVIKDAKEAEDVKGRFEIDVKEIGPHGVVVSKDGKVLFKFDGKDGDARVDVKTLLRHLGEMAGAEEDGEVEVEKEIVVVEPNSNVRLWRVGEGTGHGAGLGTIVEQIMKELHSKGVDGELMKTIAEIVRNTMANRHHRVAASTVAEPQRVQDSIQTLRDEVRSLREDMKELREALKASSNPR